MKMFPSNFHEKIIKASSFLMFKYLILTFKLLRSLLSDPGPYVRITSTDLLRFVILIDYDVNGQLCRWYNVMVLLAAFANLYFRNNITINLFTNMCLKSFIMICVKFGSDCF